MFRNFDQFLFEKSEAQSDLKKVYAVVDTKTGHRWGKSEGAEVFEVINHENIDSIKELNPDIPILCYSIPLMQKLEKLGLKNKVYNSPKTVEKSSSKEKFHKIVEGNKNIPKTAFNEKDAVKLGFPLIAKPKEGHSGLGIKVFHDLKEFEKEDHSKFDVYSEFIDKKSEHRMINFNGEPFVWFEREAQNEKAKGGKADSKGKMLFGYTLLDEKNLPENFKKVNSAFCKLFDGINPICFDVMEDQDGKLYIIESNSMAGMPFNISLQLYEKIFEDFYGRPVNDASKAKIDELGEAMIEETLSREDRRWSYKK